MNKKFALGVLIAAGLIFLLTRLATGIRSATPVVSSVSKSASSAPRRSEAEKSAPAGQFDFFLLNLSWSPEFCYSHPAAPECATHAAFVLHGLWPQNNDGTYPENCSNAPGPSNPAAFKDIYPDAGLLEHEWQAHGTCSGLEASDFFSAARTAFHSIKVPANLIGLTSQISLPPAQIIDLFTASNPSIPPSSLAVSCGNNFLTAIEVCLDKNLHPIGCKAVRSCRANTVRIPPPR